MGCHVATWPDLARCTYELATRTYVLGMPLLVLVGACVISTAALAAAWWMVR